MSEAQPMHGRAHSLRIGVSPRPAGAEGQLEAAERGAPDSSSIALPNFIYPCSAFTKFTKSASHSQYLYLNQLTLSLMYLL